MYVSVRGVSSKRKVRRSVRGKATTTAEQNHVETRATRGSTGANQVEELLHRKGKMLSVINAERVYDNVVLSLSSLQCDHCGRR